MTNDNMRNRESIKLNINLKDSRLTPEQKAKVYDLIEEHHDRFSLGDETGTCPQAEVHFKLCDEVPFFAHMW